MIRARRTILGMVIASVAGVVLILAIRSIVREPAEAGLAREAVAQGQADEARRFLDRWAALKPRSGEPDYYRALLDLRSDRPAESLEAMRRSIARGYDERSLQILRAILLARAGKFTEAEPVLSKAFEDGAEPRVEVAEGLSRVYLKTFRLDEALRVLDAWAKVAPDDARPYVLRNEVQERVNADPAVIVRTYREALRRDPNLIAPRLALAEKLREGGQGDEAEVEYEELLKRDPKNLVGLAGSGRLALTKGDLANAVQKFEAVLAIDPVDKDALRELGLIDMNSGRFAGACARLKRAVEVDPYDPIVRYTYSRALKLTGDDTRAAEEAEATDRLKKEQKKIYDLSQSLVLRHDDVDLRCEAARYLIEHGHEKEGLEWTALILRQRPGHPATCQLLAEYHTKRGEAGLANFYRLNATPTPAKSEKN